MTKNSKIRVRFAPSPTGPLHIGAARTTLFNYLFAKKHKGDFILRIEDTDKKRSKKEYEEDILNSLEWLGLKWDEVYKQSKRIKVYKKYLKKLLDQGKAYKKDIIWFKNPFRKIVFDDLIRGRVEVDSAVFGDFSLAKSLEEPLYNFAAVVDDYEMKISHVIRGEDHISNTPKQILIYEALGWASPQFAHLPLILGADKSKLSKRHGTVSMGEYKERGYLPEALINFMALLGWSPQSGISPQRGGNSKHEDIFTLEELIKEFSLEKIQKGGAIFNINKLDWFNGYYIRQKSLDDLAMLCIPYLVIEGLIKPVFATKQYPPAYGGYTLEQKYIIPKTQEEISCDKLKKIIGLEQERMKKLSEIGDMVEFFFKEPRYKAGILKWKDMKKKKIVDSLNKLEEILSGLKTGDFKRDKLNKILMTEADKLKDRGELLWPLRVVLTGREKSPGPFEIAEILGREKVLKRIKHAQKLLR